MYIYATLVVHFFESCLLKNCILKLKSIGHQRILILKNWAKYFSVKCIQAATRGVLLKKENTCVGDSFSFINFNLKVLKSLYEIFHNE